MTHRLELRGGSKNQCFHLWPIKTSLFLPIKGCTIFRFFYYQNTPTPGNTEIPLKARQHIYLRKSDLLLRRRQEIESKEMRNIIWSLQYYKSSHSHGYTVKRPSLKLEALRAPGPGLAIPGLVLAVFGGGLASAGWCPFGSGLWE